MLKSKRKKIIKYIVLPIIVVWIIISIAWLLHIQSFNKYYDDNFEHLHQYTSHIDRSGPILFGVCTPVYPEFGGNLTCNSEDQLITILAWPSFMCKRIKEYGLILKDGEGSGHMIYVDENMNYYTDLNPGISIEEDTEVKEIMKIKQDEINALFSQFKNKFNID